MAKAYNYRDDSLAELAPGLSSPPKWDNQAQAAQQLRSGLSISPVNLNLTRNNQVTMYLLTEA